MANRNSPVYPRVLDGSSGSNCVVAAPTDLCNVHTYLMKQGIVVQAGLPVTVPNILQ